MNDTLTLLRDAVDRLLADTVSPRTTLQAEHDGLDEAAWTALKNIGVVGAQDGALPLDELAVVIESVATAGALLPYADGEAIGRWLASAAGLDTGGRMLTALVVADDTAAGAVEDEHGRLQLSLAGLTIPWGCRAELLLLSLRRGDRCLVAAKPLRDIELKRQSSLAGEPHGVVVGGPLTIDAGALREVDAAFGPDVALRRGALCRSVQMLGAMSRAHVLTLRYSHERKQFKRPLADFQVIQSYLAAMAGELCAAAAAVQAAVEAMMDEDGSDAAEAVATAKLRVGQAARQVAQMAHQVHGAIGFTQEYPLNLWTRRLWTWREEYGNEAHWAAELGRVVIGHGADALWPRLTRPSIHAASQECTHG